MCHPCEGETGRKTCILEAGVLESASEDGYSLPFISLPQKVFLRNHSSVSENSDFVSCEVSKLVASGAITEVNRDELSVCNPLGVVRNSGGRPRLIVDLRYVNKHLTSCKFKYEDVRTAAELFPVGDWFFKFDYRSGQHHIEIFPLHCCFLGFSVIHEDHLRFFQFTVLLIGLSMGLYLFTKIQRPLVKHWRGKEMSAAVRYDNYISEWVHNCQQQEKPVDSAADTRIQGTKQLMHLQ